MVNTEENKIYSSFDEWILARYSTIGTTEMKSASQVKRHITRPDLMELTWDARQPEVDLLKEENRKLKMSCVQIEEKLQIAIHNLEEISVSSESQYCSYQAHKALVKIMRVGNNKEEE